VAQLIGAALGALVATVLFRAAPLAVREEGRPPVREAA
jgi:glycerol uptake facilitator-like aquaporin